MTRPRSFKDRIRERRLDWEASRTGGSIPSHSRYFASTTAYKDILTALAEGFTEQGKILSRFVRPNNTTPTQDVMTKLQNLKSIINTGGAGQAWIVQRMAQDNYRYTTQMSVGSLSSAAGRYSSSVSSYLTTKETLKFEYGDMGAKALKGIVNIGANLMYDRAISLGYAAFVTEGVSLIPAALMAGGGLLLQFGGTPLADKYGRKLGSSLGEKQAIEYASNALASSLSNPTNLINYASSYLPTANGLSGGIYKGNDKFVEAFQNNDYLSGMSLKEMGVDRFEAAESVGQLAATAINKKGLFMPLAQKAKAYSATYGVDVQQVGKTMSSIANSYPGGKGRRDADARLITARMEYLMTQVLGGKDWSLRGFVITEQLANAAEQMTKASLGAQSGDAVVMYGALQRYSSENVNRSETDPTNTINIAGIVERLMKEGATQKNTGANEVLNNIGIGNREGFNGLAGNGKRFNDFIKYTVQKVGLKKGDMSINKGGGIEVGNEDQFRVIMGWLQEDVGGLKLSDGDAMLYLQYMISFANKGEVDFKSAATAAKEIENKSIEAKTSHVVFRESLKQIVINRAKATDTMLNLNRSVAQEMVKLTDLTEIYFASQGQTFVEKFVKQVNEALGSQVLSTGGSTKSTPNNGFSGIEGEFQAGQIFGSTDKVRLDSYGYGKYASRFNGNFLGKVEDVAARLQIDPNWLLAIMSFETGGTFDPGQRGDGKHWGLIQFSNSRIAGFGMSISQFTSLSQEQQMEYVYKYFAPYAGKIKSAGDLYSLVALPVTFGKDDNYLIDTDPRFPELRNVASSNPKWDMNKDGHVSAGEIRRVLFNDELSKGFLISDTNVANIDFSVPTQNPAQVGSLTAGNHIAAGLKVPMSKDSSGIGLKIAAAARAKLMMTDYQSWKDACAKFARQVFEKALGYREGGLGVGGKSLFKGFAYQMPDEWAKRHLILTPQQVIASGGFQPGDLIMSSYDTGHVAIVDVDGTIIQAGTFADKNTGLYKRRTTLGEQFKAGTWTVGRLSLDIDGDLKGDVTPQVYIQGKGAQPRTAMSMDEALQLLQSRDKNMTFTWQPSPDGKGYIIVVKYKTSNGYTVVKDKAVIEKVRSMVASSTGLNIKANNSNVLKIKVNTPGVNKAGAAAQVVRTLAPNTR